MQRDTILITGDFVMPDKDAAAIRVRGLAKALFKKGYTVVFIGKNFGSCKVNPQTNIVDDSTWEMRPPYQRRAYYCDGGYLFDKIGQIGVNRVKAVIMYHQPAISALKIYKYCQKNHIMAIADITEWYASYQMLQNKHALFTIADFYFRMLYVNKKIGNLIVISTFLKEFYEKKKLNVLQIPILNINNGGAIKERKWNQLRLCYCGSPAKKDLLEPIVSAVNKVNESGKAVELHIVGITQKDYFALYNVKESLHENIRFYGRVEHEKAIEVLRSCDFSLIIRKNERYAKAGFPTKMVEALSNGVGVIATPCGDIPKYIVNDQNGYIVDFDSVEEGLIALILKLIQIDDSDIVQIKEAALQTAKDSFLPEVYSEQLGSFINE